MDVLFEAVDMEHAVRRASPGQDEDARSTDSMPSHGGDDMHSQAAGAHPAAPPRPGMMTVEHPVLFGEASAQTHSQPLAAGGLPAGVARESGVPSPASSVGGHANGGATLQRPCAGDTTPPREVSPTAPRCAHAAPSRL